MESQVEKKRGHWYWGAFLLIGVIYSPYSRTKTNEDALVVIAVGAIIFYYWIKSKLPIKNGFVKVISAFLLTEILAGLIASGF